MLTPGLPSAVPVQDRKWLQKLMGGTVRPHKLPASAAGLYVIMKLSSSNNLRRVS